MALPQPRLQYRDARRERVVQATLTAMRVAMFLASISAALSVGCASDVAWRHAGFRAVPDETANSFELVIGMGLGDKGGEWAPLETVVKRIDGQTGKVLSQNRTWGRPEPQPNLVFGWKGDFVLFDADLVTFRRSANVLAGARPINPVEAALAGR